MNKRQREQLKQIDLLLEKAVLYHNWNTKQKFNTPQEKILYEYGYMKGILSELAAEYWLVERDIKNRINKTE